MAVPASYRLVRGRTTFQGTPPFNQKSTGWINPFRGQLSPPLHPGQPMASAFLVLWEMCFPSSLGLYPKNVRGWSGHFQPHFLSTWEQAACSASEPSPRALPSRLSVLGLQSYPPLTTRGLVVSSATVSYQCLGLT